MWINTIQQTSTKRGVTRCIMAHGKKWSSIIYIYCIVHHPFFFIVQPCGLAVSLAQHGSASHNTLPCKALQLVVAGKVEDHRDVFQQLSEIECNGWSVSWAGPNAHQLRPSNTSSVKTRRNPPALRALSSSKRIWWSDTSFIKTSENTIEDIMQIHCNSALLTSPKSWAT